MAAEDEGRTEEASESKLEKARKEGRVAKTAELSGGLILLFTVLTIIVFSKFILNQIISAFKFYFSLCNGEEINYAALFEGFLNYYLKCIIPVAIVGAISAILGNVLQTKGFIFSLKPIQPDFKRIVPNIGQYLKKTLFSLKGLFNVVKSIGKVAVICVIAYIFIRKDIFVLIDIIDNGDVSGAVAKVAKMCAQILLTVSVFFVAISIPDFFVQKKDFLDEMKMTVQEVKEEYKEMEGDPQVKSRLEKMQRELLSRNIPKAVSEADVVITNPTHYAVSLKWDNNVSNAPLLTAKGVDQTAMYIKQLARDNDVPIVENRIVARALYTNLEIGDIIPEDYMRAIAVIYSNLEKFKNYSKL